MDKSMYVFLIAITIFLFPFSIEKNSNLKYKGGFLN